MSVHYKFKSAVEYDTLPVDGLNISLGDLKEAIIQQKRLGKGQPYDLQITNAETREVYVDEKKLIPKNSSLIVARVPIDASQMKRPWENKESTALILANPSNLMNTEDAAEVAEMDRKIKEVTDLTRMEGSEQDKINAMVAQSTMEYHPSKYVKLRASKMTGSVPSGYKCYKCNQSGHWVTMCPLNNQDLMKSTGIPSMFLEEVADATAPGVMISASGKLVRLRDIVSNKNIGVALPPAERQPTPDELECLLCKELLKDAVLIPCCAAAFCDECIRNHLLDSEDHGCPTCEKEGIGPDTLIPNRYLRIRVQQFEFGYYFGDKKTDASSDVSDSLSAVPAHVLQTRNTPTPPPHSPSHSASPARIRISDKLATSPISETPCSPTNDSAIGSPISQTAGSPAHEKSPSRIRVIEPIGNGNVESDKENIVNEITVKTEEIRDALNEHEGELLEEHSDREKQLTGKDKENIGMNEVDDGDIDEKPKKIKKKKGKRKNSRHESDDEKEKDRKKKERRSSHKSQDKKVSSLEKKSKHRGMELLKDVADLPDEAAELWDDDNMADKIPHQHDEGESTTPKKKRKHRNSKDMLLKDVGADSEEEEEEEEQLWNDMRPKMESTEVKNRSRSNSEENEKDNTPIFDNIVPFNPRVPPPNVFVKSPPQDYRYPVTAAFVPQGPPPPHSVPVNVPVPAENAYPHYQPGIPPPTITNPSLSYPRHHPSYAERELIADPLTEFEKHMREKDERDRKWRYSRSRSPSRSPRYRRVRSRSRQRNSWSRSRSRSLSRPRGGVPIHSPRSPSRRRWSRSPPPRGHASYRSRSPSFTREHSVSNRSLSLSRTPSPCRRIKTSPLHIGRVHPPKHPDSHALARPSIEYGAQRDYNRYPMTSLPHEQFTHQPPPPFHPNTPHWDPHTSRYNQAGSDNFKPNFTDQRGRGNRGRRGRGVGFRQGENFGYEHRGQDFRHQFDRSQRNYEDRRGLLQGSGPWEREGRQSFNTEIPRSDRGNRHTDGDRRRFADHNEYEEIRPLRDNAENVRRLDEGHGQNIYSDEEERRKYSDDGRKRGEEPDRRGRYEGRRGLEDRTDDPEVRKASDVDDYEDFKRVRKDDGKKSYERGYKEMDEVRSGCQERDGGKHRSALRRESPREEEMHFRSKSYDSPGKGLKKSSPKERRDREADSSRRGGGGDRDVDRRDHEVERKDRVGDRRDRDGDRRDRDGDRRDRDGDRRDRDSDKREVDRRVKDVDRRDRDVDRRERDDKRERDLDKQERESEKRDKDYDRKESYKKDRDQDRKLRDGDRDRREKGGDRREREPPRRERDIVNKDKIERNDSDRKDRESDKSYVSRWDHGDTKLRSDKEIDKKSKSRERERSLVHDEKEHKRKSKRKEESHHSKEKGNGPPDSEHLKVEKKKHDKKKKKKEKRRASQASTEASQGEVSGDEAEDKKKKKKRERKRRAKGTPQDEAMDESVEDKVLENEEQFPGDGERAQSAGKTVHAEQNENDPEMTTPPREGTPDPTASEESPATLLPLPPLSKWERDEDLTLTPKGLVENKAPEEEKKVTVDIIKRAENTIFSGRVLAPRKVFLDPQKPKGNEEKERSPTPEWDRLELREAKRKGQSIQITISSKTENQIGRPKGGRYQSDKHSRSQKRSQSPSEPQSSTRTRRRSEKEEHTKDERERSVSADRSGANSEPMPSEYILKVDDCDNYKEPVEDGLRECTSRNSEPDAQLKLENVRETSLKPCDNHENTKPFVEVSDKSVKEERIGAQKGVKRSSSSSTEELEVKKLKTEDEYFPMEGNISRRESIENEENKSSASIKGEPEYGIPVLGESNIKDHESSLDNIKSPKHVIHNVTNSNLVMIPMAPQEGEELEEGEIASDSVSEVDRIPEEEEEEEEAVLEAPLELRGMVEEEATMDESLKDFQKIRYSPIRVPSPVEPGEAKETSKVKEKSKKRKKRKRSSSSSSSNSSSSSSSSSSEEEEIVKKKKKKKKKKKIVNSDSSDGESQRKHKKKKKDKKKKKKKEKKKKSDK